MTLKMTIQTDKRERFRDLYANKVILAPMVRENSLPFRLLCLEMGADLVYTEELVDHGFSRCKRIENHNLKTVDFVDQRGKVIFRTCQAERNYVIVQLGSNDPDRALKAAKLVENDVAGVDFNFGCPKSFSLSGGMGAAMLEKPDQIKALLTHCVSNLDIPVTCKIRILPDIDATLKLVKMIESCGVSAIAVHGRTKDQRPKDENDNEVIKLIANSLTIPVIANGGSNHIKSYNDIIDFRNLTGASSVMIARAAMRNPSIFRKDLQTKSILDQIHQFLRLCIKYDNYMSNTKYATLALMANGHFGGDLVRKFHGIRDMKPMWDLFQIPNEFEKKEEEESDIR